MRYFLAFCFFICLIGFSLYAEFRWKIVETITNTTTHYITYYQEKFTPKEYKNTEELNVYYINKTPSNENTTSVSHIFTRIKDFFSSDITKNDAIPPHVLDSFVEYPSNNTQFNQNAAYLEIPLARLVQKHILFVVWQYNNKKITFFVIKDNKESLQNPLYKIVLNACRFCYKENQGFSIKNNYFICNDCGIEFHKERVGIAKGGCNPIVLPFHRENQSLFVEKSILEKLAVLF